MNTKFKTVMLALAFGLGWLLPQCGQAFYNPSTGRWLSRDPINDPGHELSQVPDLESAPAFGGIDEEQNVYLFASNNSIANVDPFGTTQCNCVAGTPPPPPALPGCGSAVKLGTIISSPVFAGSCAKTKPISIPILRSCPCLTVELCKFRVDYTCSPYRTRDLWHRPVIRAKWIPVTVQISGICLP